MNHPNEGIKCVVNTCHYYMNGDHCSAKMIEVEPRDAKRQMKPAVQHLYQMFGHRLRALL